MTILNEILNDMKKQDKKLYPTKKIIYFINHENFRCNFDFNYISTDCNNDLIIITNELKKNDIEYSIEKSIFNSYNIKLKKNIISYSDNHYDKRFFNKCDLNKDISSIVIS